MAKSGLPDILYQRELGYCSEPISIHALGHKKSWAGQLNPCLVRTITKGSALASRAPWQKGGNLDRMIEGLPFDVRVKGHEAEIRIARNDWTKDTNGQAYLERLVNLTGPDTATFIGSIREQLETELAGYLHASGPEKNSGNAIAVGGKATPSEVAFSPRFTPEMHQEMLRRYPDQEGMFRITLGASAVRAVLGFGTLFPIPAKCHK